MDKSETIKILEDLCNFGIDSTWDSSETTKAIENVLNLVSKSEKEVEKLKLMLFMVVRNSVVLPKGIELSKDEKKISDMTKLTIQEIEKMLNFDKARELYEL